MVRIPALGVGVIVLTAVVVGCENPALNQRWDRRRDNLGHTANRLAENEADRMEKLGAALDLLARQHERDVANSRRNPARVRRWLTDDVERWNQQQPVYRQRVAEQLAGDPAEIERTVPKILE